MSTAGWMPRASSRSSSSAASSSDAASASRLLRVHVVLHARAGQAQLQRHRHEPLLGAVVEVALEPAALLEAGHHAAPALLAQLLDLRAQLGVEALVLERQRGRRAHGGDQVALVVERARRGRSPPPACRGPPRSSPRARRPGSGSSVGRPGRVHVALARRAASRGASGRDRRARRPARRAARRRRSSAVRRATRSATAPARDSRLRIRPTRKANGTISGSRARPRRWPSSTVSGMAVTSRDQAESSSVMSTAAARYTGTSTWRCVRGSPVPAPPERHQDQQDRDDGQRGLDRRAGCPPPGRRRRRSAGCWPSRPGWVVEEHDHPPEQRW